MRATLQEDVSTYVRHCTTEVSAPHVQHSLAGQCAIQRVHLKWGVRGEQSASKESNYDTHANNIPHHTKSSAEPTLERIRLSNLVKDGLIDGHLLFF